MANFTLYSTLLDKIFLYNLWIHEQHSAPSPLNPKELREWRTRNLNCNSRNSRKIRLIEGNAKCLHLKN
jgi:hypothetical protein